MFLLAKGPQPVTRVNRLWGGVGWGEGRDRAPGLSQEGGKDWRGPDSGATFDHIALPREPERGNPGKGRKCAPRNPRGIMVLPYFTGAHLQSWFSLRPVALILQSSALWKEKIRLSPVGVTKRPPSAACEFLPAPDFIFCSDMAVCKATPH